MIQLELILCSPAFILGCRQCMPSARVYVGVVFVYVWLPLKLHFWRWWIHIGLYLLAIPLYVHLQMHFFRGSSTFPSHSAEEISVFTVLRSSRESYSHRNSLMYCLILACGIPVSNVSWKCCRSTMVLILKLLNWNPLSVGTRKKTFIALDPVKGLKGRQRYSIIEHSCNNTSLQAEC